LRRRAAGALDARHQRRAELRARRLVGVGDGEQLEVAAARRHDPVVRADAVVAPAADGDEPEALLYAARGRVEVRRRVDDVVDAHRGANVPPARRLGKGSPSPAYTRER
jgi:hypothetical protein